LPNCRRCCAAPQKSG